jgi:AAA domain
LFGSGGSGKSGIAYHAKNPFFLITDRCTSWIDKPRFIDDEGLTETCKTYDEFMGKLRFVAKKENVTSQGVGYDTLVIDSLTALEDLIALDIVDRSPKIKIDGIMQKPTCLDEMGYSGRGLVMPYWHKLLKACEIINDAGISIILIGHSTLKNVAGESLEQYKMHDMTLQAFGAHNVPDLLKRSVDWCFFVSSAEEMVSSKRRAVGSANEVLTTVRTRPTSLFFAKSQGANVKEIQGEYTFTPEDRKDICEKMFDDIMKANNIETLPSL